MAIVSVCDTYHVRLSYRSAHRREDYSIICVCVLLYSPMDTDGASDEAVASAALAASAASATAEQHIVRYVVICQVTQPTH